MIIFSDLKNRTKITSLPKWAIKKIESNFSNIQIIFDKKKINEKVQIYFGDLISENIVKKMPNLKWVHFSSTGTNKANNKEIIKRKIIVTNSNDAFTNSVSILAIAHICSFARGLHFASQLRKKKQLNRETFDKYFKLISDLRSSTVLIVGYGKIGRKVSEILFPMGVNVIGIKKRKNYNKKYCSKIFQLKDLDKVVSKADFVINLLPLERRTKKIFNKNIFKKMKNTSYFISLGRGETVNEKDLINSLEKNIIAGAGIDVFENEPLSNNTKLLKLKNTILTPHVGNINQQYWEYETNLFIKNLNSFINRKKFVNRVYPKL